MVDLSEVRTLFNPERLVRGSEIVGNGIMVPKFPGVYAWYFRNFPAEIPTDGCEVHQGLTLLYIGIVPKNLQSQRTLHDRIKTHLAGNAESSTLRFSLGCILSTELKIQLRRAGSGKRKTFADGEKILDEWLANNAFVTWVIREHPWEIEKKIIQSVSLPINLKHNQSHPYHSILSEKRKAARELAQELPIL